MIDKMFFDIILGLSVLGLTVLFTRRELLDKYSQDYINLSITLLPYVLLTGLASAYFSIGFRSVETMIFLLIGFSLVFVLLDRLDVDKALISSLSLGIGLLILLFSVSNLSIRIFSTLEILGIAIISTAPFIVVLYFADINVTLSLLLFTHFLDASSTVIALREGLEETRILASLFIELLGPYGILVMKSIVFLPLIYYIDRELEEGEEREKMILLFSGITAYGIALAARNYFLILSVS